MKKTSRNILPQTMANHYESSPHRTNGSSSGNNGNCHKANGSENNNQPGEIGNGIGQGNGGGKIFIDADILVKSQVEPGKTGGDAAPLMPAKNNTTAATAVAVKTNNHHNTNNHSSNNNNHSSNNNNNNVNSAMKGGPSEEQIDRKSERKNDDFNSVLTNNRTT